ncbi:MAG: chorismate-binding protein [Flavobacteriales bacterium]|nr:chorismate-binding protein [Flavobacteriales bacterium]
MREAQTLMEEGPLEKVVLSRALLAGLPEGAVAHLFMEALTVHPETLVALAHTPATGTWLGASPERLISFENELVRTEAVAGTRSVDQGPVELEAWGEKERHEQAVVAQAVEQALMASGARSIHQHPAEVITQGRLAHLRTRFTAELSTVDRARLVAHLHPTPAVCGSPREKALAFIASHEAHPRGLYAGYWGVWDPAGRTELFVNIRCLQAHGEKAVVYAGAGITAGSDPGMEWLETSRKAAIWSGPLNKLMPSPTSSHT